MYEHKRLRTIIIFSIVLVAFTAIYLVMARMADYEELMLRSKILDVQRSIAENMATDYESGVNLVGELIESNQDDQVLIRFQMIDDLIAHESDEDAKKFIKEVMNLHVDRYAIFDYSSLVMKDFVGNSNNYIPNAQLADVRKSLVRGTMLQRDGTVLNVEQPSDRPLLYFYWLKNKNWIVVSECRKIELEAVKDSAKAILEENFKRINGYLSYDIIVLNEDQMIADSSNKDFIGLKVNIDNAYHKYDMSLFRLTGGKEQNIELIGNQILTKGSNIIFATRLENLQNEKKPIQQFLQAILLTNLVLTIAIIHLLAQNYLYFLESRKKEEGEFDENL